MSGSPPSSGSHGEFPPSSGSHGESSTRTSGPSSGNNTEDGEVAESRVDNACNTRASELGDTQTRHELSDTRTQDGLGGTRIEHAGLTYESTISPTAQTQVKEHASPKNLPEGQMYPSPYEHASQEGQMHPSPYEKIQIVVSEETKKTYGPLQMGSSEKLRTIYLESNEADFYKLHFIFQNWQCFLKFCGKMKERNWSVMKNADTITILFPFQSRAEGLKSDIIQGIVKGMLQTLTAVWAKCKGSSAKTVVEKCRETVKEHSNGEVLVYPDEDDDTLLWFVSEKTKEDLMRQILDRLGDGGFTESRTDIRWSEYRTATQCPFPVDSLEMAIFKEFNVEHFLKDKVIKIVVDEANSVVVISAMSNNIPYIKNVFDNLITEKKETKSRISVPKCCKNFIEMQELKKKVKWKVPFLIHEGYVYAKSNEDANNIASGIGGLFHEENVDVKAFNTDSASLKRKFSEWTEECCNIIGFEITESSITLYGLREHVDVILPRLKSYIQENTKVLQEARSSEKYTINEVDRHGLQPQDELDAEDEVTGEIVTENDEEVKWLMGHDFQKTVVEMKEKHHCSVRVDLKNVYPLRQKTSNGCLWKFGNEKQVFFNRTKASDVVGNNTDCVIDFLPESEKPEARGDEVPFFKRANFSNHVQLVCVYLPIWRDGNAQEKDKLRKQILLLLEKLQDVNLTSLTIPLHTLSSLKWPASKLLKQILFLKRNFINTTVFCHPDVNEYNKLLPIFESLTDEMNSTAVNIRVEKKRFTDVKVQVLVNTTGRELTLHQGYVSNSILMAAGKEMQTEAYSKCPNGLKAGEILVTDAYNLRERGIRKVFHGSLPVWKGIESVAVLKIFVAKCLHRASELGMTSIAFPSLGTGNLGYDHNTVATAMFEIVRSFVESAVYTCLTDIVFVVFDEKSNQAFFKEESKYYNMPCTSGHFKPQIYKFPENGVSFEVNCGEVWIHGVQGIALLYDGSEIFQPGYRACVLECGRLAKDLWKSSSEKQRLQTKKLHVYKVVISQGPMFFHMKLDPGSEAEVASTILKSAEHSRLNSVAFVVTKKDGVAGRLPDITKSVFEAAKQIKGSTLKRIILVVDTSICTAAFKTLKDPAFDLYNVQKKTKTCHILFKSKSHRTLQDAKKEVMSALENIRSSKQQEQLGDDDIKRKTFNNPLGQNKKQEDEEIASEKMLDQKGVEVKEEQLSRLGKEKCALLLNVNIEQSQKIDTDSMKEKLKRDIEGIFVPVTIIFPFLTDKEALLKFSTKEELQEFKTCFKSDEYQLRDVPVQAVTCVSATLSKTASKLFHEKGWIPEDIFENSGVTLKNQGGSIVLKGSLLEIQVAREFIRKACHQSKTPESKNGNSSAKQEPKYNVHEENNANGTVDKWDTPEKGVHGSSSLRNVSLKNIPEIPCSSGSMQLKEPVEQTMRQSKHRINMSTLEYKILQVQHFQSNLQEMRKKVHINEKESVVEITGHYDVLQHYEEALEEIQKMKRETINLKNHQMIKNLESLSENLKSVFSNVIFLKHDDKLHFISVDDLKDCKSTVLAALKSPQEKRNSPRLSRRVNSHPKENDSSQAQMPEMKKHYKDKAVFTQKGVSVYVDFGDILSTADPADCFVNPTNEYLDLESRGGFSAAVLKKAGYKVQEECKQLIGRKKLKHEECVTTNAGDLKYLRIIHTTVEPWKNFQNRKTQVEDAVAHIEKVVNNCLKAADNCKMKSIAFPGIGSGQSAIPHILCGMGFRKGCESFLKTAPSKLRHIYFVINDENFFSLLEMSFRTPLPWYSVWPEYDEYTFHLSKKCIVTVAKRDVLLENGVDGLVVLEDPSMSGKGNVVKAVLTSAHKSFKQNRESIPGKFHTLGTAVPCKYSGKGGYKTVLHIIMPDSKIKPWNAGDVEKYKACISAALTTQKGMKIIAMKLFIGRTEERDVIMYLAKALVEAVTEYISHNKDSSLQEIRILNKETVRYELVKEELKKFVLRACNSNSYLENALVVNCNTDPQTKKTYEGSVV